MRQDGLTRLLRQLASVPIRWVALSLSRSSVILTKEDFIPCWQQSYSKACAKRFFPVPAKPINAKFMIQTVIENIRSSSSHSKELLLANLFHNNHLLFFRIFKISKIFFVISRNKISKKTSRIYTKSITLISTRTMHFKLLLMHFLKTIAYCFKIVTFFFTQQEKPRSFFT